MCECVRECGEDLVPVCVGRSSYMLCVYGGVMRLCSTYTPQGRYGRCRSSGSGSWHSWGNCKMTTISELM